MAESTIYWQDRLTLPVMPRGFHLITRQIQQQFNKAPTIQSGLLHVFLQHTSASLTISENTCSDVALDLETHFNRLFPDDNTLYQHTLEGDDDMPAHLKNTVLGCQLTLPVSEGQMALGRWQGIFLCEHRNHAGSRSLVLTLHGQ